MLPAEYRELFNRNFSFWEHLTEKQKDTLCANATVASYNKGATLQSGSRGCLGVTLVKSGQLRIYMLSEDGREITLYRLYQGDTCILSASCVLEAITFDVFIDAESDCELLLINSTVFNKLTEENIYVEAFGYKLATERFSDVMWAMQQILFMSFDKRLAIFLVDELSKTGSQDINFTHEQIAKYMGSAREVVTRMLKHFVNEGIVELYRGGIRVTDKKKLKSLI
jgi:CRP/FNR family transcriptional regulator